MEDRHAEQSGAAHRTVLLDEAVDALVWREDGVYVDGTFGRGGHSRLILQRFGAAGRLLAFDKDAEAIAAGESLAQEVGRAHEGRPVTEVGAGKKFEVIHASFADMGERLAERGVRAAAGVLLDLGVSSPQLDQGERGFSFRQDGPLDMRMDTSRGLTSAQWLAQADEQEIAKVIRDYGEERFAVPIAKAIVARRQQAGELGPLERTAELAAVVAQAVKTREKGQDPATRTFQAIRIFVNQELEDLSRGLTAAMDLLETGGRLVVISFHSLEDRVVKQFMQTHAGKRGGWLSGPQDALSRRLPMRGEIGPAPRLKLLGKSKPGELELAGNRRARSAIMRVAEKLQ
ncbi:MAG: 16S rRNA (cytosine(1402)-N(4))-methyltransferase RsmH [Candidatus Protistobacter heckmanni]|nr:16S rRNA (cytosine(1402)-N(4))-methyltransferase RsmH [Candidatus Protistobacter heckmanni]